MVNAQTTDIEMVGMRLDYLDVMRETTTLERCQLAYYENIGKFSGSLQAKIDTLAAQMDSLKACIGENKNE